MSDLEQILNGEQPEPVVTPETPEEPQEPETPEEAAADPEPPTEPGEKPKAEEPAMVPLAALQEVRGELRDIKALYAAQNEPAPQPAPDFYEDPQGAMQHQMAPVQAQVADFRLDMSEEMTVTMLDMQSREDGKTGRQVVDDAIEALRSSQNSAAYQEIMSQKNPYMALVKWHQQHQVAQEIGSDPEAWKAQQREAIRQEIQAEMVAEQAQARAAAPAPSMANANGTGGGSKPTEWGGPTKLDSLF